MMKIVIIFFDNRRTDNRVFCFLNICWRGVNRVTTVTKFLKNAKIEDENKFNKSLEKLFTVVHFDSLERNDYVELYLFLSYFYPENKFRANVIFKIIEDNKNDLAFWIYLYKISWDEILIQIVSGMIYKYLYQDELIDVFVRMVELQNILFDENKLYKPKDSVFTAWDIDPAMREEILYGYYISHPAKKYFFCFN